MCTRSTRSMRGISEGDVLAEIDFFQRTRRAASPGRDHEDVYADFIARRRRLLAALRDGHPEAWRDYPASPARGDEGK